MAARQVEGHGSAVSELAGDCYSASRLAGEAVNLRQPQSSALVQLLGRKKRLEHLRQDIVCYSAPGIRYCQSNKFATDGIWRVLRLHSCILSRDYDRPAVGHRVSCIDDQVDQGELQFMNVDRDGPDTAPDIDHQRDIAAGRTHKQIAKLCETLAQADDHRVEGLAPRKGEQLACEPFTACRRKLDRFDRA